MSFNVGENVGPYRIVEQLGQGGMATVFKAYHASLDRYVAIKALHPAFNQDPNFEARFQREAQVVAKLEHPNIVPVYDYAEHENRPYLIMKFVEGDTLKARMDKGPLTADEITKVVDAVGSGLSYAHKQGVLHRDIKPSNVLLADDDRIYIADFGLARMAQAGESTLSSDMMLGTPQYISPEQAMGKSDLDARTDLYSFGVMLYEMVVGKVPFSADTPFSIIHDHIYSPLPLPRTVNPDVPEPVERILLKALAKERDDRFGDAMDLVKAFKMSWNEAGVPMQGSDLSASHVARVENQVAAQPPVELEPTKVASASANVAEVEEIPVETEAVSTSKKKRSPWMWVSVGLAVVLCVGLFAFARSRRLFSKLLAEPEAPVAGLPDNPNPPPPGAPDDGPPGPPDGGQNEFIEEARMVANENPDDPFAQLDLALAYWEMGQPRETYDTVPAIMRAAGPDDEDFYWVAGDDFLDDEAWIPAAVMYMQVMRINRDRGEAPDEDLIEVLHESLYKGAERPEAKMILPLDMIAEVDEPISLITKARIELYSGRVSDGYVFLNQARRFGDMPEIILLQAEFDRREGKSKEARDAAKALSENFDIPEWIRILAEEFLKRTL